MAAQYPLTSSTKTALMPSASVAVNDLQTQPIWIGPKLFFRDQFDLKHIQKKEAFELSMTKLHSCLKQKNRVFNALSVMPGQKKSILNSLDNKDKDYQILIDSFEVLANKIDNEITSEKQKTLWNLK